MLARPALRVAKFLDELAVFRGGCHGASATLGSGFTGRFFHIDAPLSLAVHFETAWNRTSTTPQTQVPGFGSEAGGLQAARTATAFAGRRGTAQAAAQALCVNAHEPCAARRCPI